MAVLIVNMKDSFVSCNSDIIYKEMWENKISGFLVFNMINM